jgi:hypothetical protein
MPRDEMRSLPCGCRFGTCIDNGERTLVFEPCGRRCPNYLAVTDELMDQGKPIEVRRVKR